MRKILQYLLLSCLACAAARAADLQFKRVWPEWVDAEAFGSYHEYKTGQEIAGNWTVLRSRPEKRGGLYFMTRIENPGEDVRGASVVLHVISPDSNEPRTFTFPVDVPTKGREFEIGLTGADWSGQHVQPVAWEIELHAKDGTLLARKASFLWELPSH
jgi:hypothetical protein